MIWPLAGSRFSAVLIMVFIDGAMGKLLISELDEQQEITGLFMVRGCHLRPLRDPSRSFLVLNLVDKSGEIEAKLWDDAEQWYQQLHSETVVKIAGRTQLFNGRLELNVSRLRVAREEEYAIDEFLPATTRDRSEMLEELDAVVASVGNQDLAGLLNDVFNTIIRREFANAPGAKLVHHAYLGGLLEHTLEVVKLCRAAVEIHPEVDSDLLLTGALLHDIGKIKEYVFRRTIDFSDEGRLIGHVVLGEEMLVGQAQKIEGFPDELLLHLRHMILSHHGQYEWQSPKRPKTIEACVLHLADYFSAQMAIFSDSLKGTGDRSWTDYNRYLGRSVFAHSGSSVDRGAERKVMEEPYQGF